MSDNYCYFADAVDNASIHYKRFADFINADCAKFDEIGCARIVLRQMINCFESMHNTFFNVRQSADKYYIYLGGDLQGFIEII